MTVKDKLMNLGVRALVRALIGVELMTERFGDVGVLRPLNDGVRKLTDYLQRKYFPS